MSDVVQKARFVISFPKHFTPSSIDEVLRQFEHVFKTTNEIPKHLILDVSKIEKTSILGVLILYKMIDYLIAKGGPYKQKTLHWDIKGQFIKDLKKYGFEDLIMSFLDVKSKTETEKAYKELDIQSTDNFIIAPQALIRTDRNSRSDINKKYLPKIEEYYSGNTKAIQMIFLVFSEVLLNFWEHAVQDTKSIIVAYGNKNNIEICCADTGEGIISTLRPVLEERMKAFNILKKSVEKGVTSKQKTFHMGYGLWLLNEITTLTGGRLHLYSEGAYYYNNSNDKIKFGECPYWKGTIIYLSLPLRNPKTLEDIEQMKGIPSLNINWQ